MEKVPSVGESGPSGCTFKHSTFFFFSPVNLHPFKLPAKNNRVRKLNRDVGKKVNKSYSCHCGQLKEDIYPEEPLETPALRL